MSSPYTWFELCDIYLGRIEAMEAWVVVHDGIEAVTKEQRAEKRLAFDGFMRCLKQKDDIEKELDEKWPNQGVSPLP